MHELEFLGGAEEVGRLGMLLRGGSSTILFEYGMKPLDPPDYPRPAPLDVDAVFLTHCHLDHSGMIPSIIGRLECRLHCTDVTLDVTDLLVNDSITIAKDSGYPVPFGKDDIRSMFRNFSEVHVGDTLEVGGVEVRMHSAGHIPGAVMYEVNGHDTLLFTGDLNTVPTNLVRGASPVRCDTLVLESTYGGREHPDRKRTEAEFVARVNEVVDDGGKVVVPAFAVGRTQEVLMALMRERLSIWLDGMGKSVNRIYMGHPDHLRDAARLRRAIRRMPAIRNDRMRRGVFKQAEVIVTTSGMLNGGPVLFYLQQLRSDRRSAVLLTGYQVEGTNGRMLLEKGMVDIDGVQERIECQVGSFDLSAHAGHSELVEFARACSPERVVLMHGDADARRALASELEDAMEVILPRAGERVRV